MDVPYQIIKRPWIWYTQSTNGSGPYKRFKNGSAQYSGNIMPKVKISILYDTLVLNTAHLPLNSSILWQFDSYGGRVNINTDGTQIPESQTAQRFRTGFIKIQPQLNWNCAEQDEECINFFNTLYFKVYPKGCQLASDLPVGDKSGTDGVYINYPQSEYATGVRQPSIPSTTFDFMKLYYGDNTERLQQIKKTWDPHNRFHHDLSIPVTK